jgi:UDP-2-acetamido-3-amino-2,3-dideoxy-glucuronate N-acetyltransferase
MSWPGTDAVVNAARIHPTAVVEPGAHVGDDTAVWHHGHIRDGAVVGAGCTLGKNVFVDAGAVVGNRVKIQNNVSVYRGVTIADEVFVGPSAVFTNDRYPRAASTDWEVVPTAVQRGASIGANATIVCGVTLGEWCVVAAGAVVTRDVASHQVVAGNPARHLGWVCEHGRVVSRAQDRPESLQCGCGDG